MPREVYKVLINRPEHISPEEMSEYIVSSVSGWKGGYSTDHPLFEHNLEAMAFHEDTRPRIIRKEGRMWGQVVIEQLTSDRVKE